MNYLYPGQYSFVQNKSKKPVTPTAEVNFLNTVFHSNPGLGKKNDFDF